MKLSKINFVVFMVLEIKHDTETSCVCIGSSKVYFCHLSPKIFSTTSMIPERMIHSSKQIHEDKIYFQRHNK